MTPSGSIPLPGAGAIPATPSGSIPLPGGGAAPPPPSAPEPRFDDFDLGVPPLSPGTSSLDELDFGSIDPALDSGGLFDDPFGDIPPPAAQTPAPPLDFGPFDPPAPPSDDAPAFDFSLPPPSPDGLDLTIPPLLDDSAGPGLASVEDDLKAYLDSPALPEPPAHLHKPVPATVGTVQPQGGDVPMFHVRRKNGKRIGPFDKETLVRLARQDQLDGTEDVSQSGEEWTPIGEMPEVSQLIGIKPEPRVRTAPVLAPVLKPPNEDGRDDARAAEEPAAAEPETPKSKWLAAPVQTFSRSEDEPAADGGSRRKLLIMGGGAAAALVLLAGGAVLFLAGSDPEAAALAAQHDSMKAEIRSSLLVGHFAATQKAVRLADELVAQSPEDSTSRALQARAALSMKRRFDVAGGAADAAKATIDGLDPDQRSDDDWRKAEVESSFTFSKSIAHQGWLEEQARARPKDREILTLLAEGLHRTGKADAAADWYSKLVEAAPKSALALHGLGLLRKEAEDLDGAMDFFQRAVEADPLHAASSLELAAIAREKGEWEAALKHLEAALSKESAAGLPPVARTKGELARAELELRAKNPEGAAKAYERALALDGKSDEVRIAVVRFQHSRGLHEETIKLLSAPDAKPSGALLTALIEAQLAVGKIPEATALVKPTLKPPVKNPQTWFLQARIQEASGKREDALASLEKALELKGDHAESLIAQARLQAVAGDFPKALASIEAAEKAAPKSIEPKLAVGDIQLLAKNPEAALAAFEAALESAPDEALAHVGKGRALEAAGKVEEARAAYEAALEINDASAEALFAVGSLDWKAGELEAARKTLEKAHNLAPTRAPIALRLAAAQVDSELFDDARSVVDRALLLESDSAEGYFLRSRILQAKGDLRGAQVAAERALTLVGENADYQLQLASVFEQEGNQTQALAAYKKALALRPDLVDALEGQGRTLQALGVYAEAARSFEAALARDRSRTGLLLTIGDIHARSRSHKKAIAAYREAEKQGFPGIAFRLARVYQEDGNTNQAIVLLQRAVKEKPDDAAAWRFLGYAYKEKNRLRDAKSAFQAYLEMVPEAEDRAEILDEIATLR